MIAETELYLVGKTNDSCFKRVNKKQSILSNTVLFARRITFFFTVNVEKCSEFIYISPVICIFCKRDFYIAH